MTQQFAGTYEEWLSIPGPYRQAFTPPPKPQTQQPQPAQQKKSQPTSAPKQASSAPVQQTSNVVVGGMKKFVPEPAPEKVITQQRRPSSFPSLGQAIFDKRQFDQEWTAQRATQQSRATPLPPSQKHSSIELLGKQLPQQTAKKSVIVLGGGYIPPTPPKMVHVPTQKHSSIELLGKQLPQQKIALNKTFVNTAIGETKNVGRVPINPMTGKPLTPEQLATLKGINEELGTERYEKLKEARIPAGPSKIGSLSQSIFEFDPAKAGAELGATIFGLTGEKRQKAVEFGTEFSESITKKAGKNLPFFEEPTKALAGVVATGESLVYLPAALMGKKVPYTPTFSGAVIGDVGGLVTGKGVGATQELYEKYGRSYIEGSIAGDVLLSYAIGKAIGKGVSTVGGTVKKQLIGSKADKWLIEHSSRYKGWATKGIKPQVVSSPVFDVGQKSFAWGPTRQKAIDLAWGLEMTPKTSGITAPALLETATKTRVLPHLISRGGITSIGVLRDYGFSRSQEGLLSAPSQIGIQTTKESARVLPHVPSSILGTFSSKALSSMIGAGVSSSMRGITGVSQQNTKTPTKTKTFSGQPSFFTVGVGFRALTKLRPKTFQEETQEVIPSKREIPYLPDFLKGITHQRDMTETIVGVPQIQDTPQIPDIPQILDVPQIQDTPQIPDILPIFDVPQIQDTPQIPYIPPIFDVPQTHDTPFPTPPTRFPPPSTFKPPPFVFKLPKTKGKWKDSLFGGWRLKTHPIPTMKQINTKIVGFPTKKRLKKSKSKPQKRSGRKQKRR